MHPWHHQTCWDGMGTRWQSMVRWQTLPLRGYDMHGLKYLTRVVPVPAEGNALNRAQLYGPSQVVLLAWHVV